MKLQFTMTDHNWNGGKLHQHAEQSLSELETKGVKLSEQEKHSLVQARVLDAEKVILEYLQNASTVTMEVDTDAGTLTLIKQTAPEAAQLSD